MNFDFIFYLVTYVHTACTMHGFVSKFYISLKKEMEAVDVASVCSDFDLLCFFYAPKIGLVDSHISRYYGFNAMHMVVIRPHLLMGMYNIYSWIYTCTNEADTHAFECVNIQARRRRTRARILYVYGYVGALIGVSIFFFFSFFMLCFHRRMWDARTAF